MAADQQLASFAPYIVPGWQYGSNCGYYVHRGTVYIVGSVEAGGVNPPEFLAGSGTLLTGLPPQLCPRVSTSAPVFIDPNNSTSEYAGDAPYLPATIHPDGSWTLDGGNPVSGDGDTLLALVLSAARWPTAAATSDSPAPQSLAPYMSDGYDAGAATFAIHDARLHLSGQVTIVDPEQTNTMFRFPESMPVAPYYPDFTPDLTAGEGWTEVPVGDVRGFVLRPPPGVSGSTALSITGSMAGTLIDTYYDRSKFGYLRLGSNFLLALGALGTSDTGLGWVGMSAAPTTSPRPLDEYTGTQLAASFYANPPSQIGTDVEGPNQLAFIIGMNPSKQVYYKLVVTYVAAGHHVIATVWRCTAGGGQVLVGGGEIGGWTAGPPEVINGLVLLDMSMLPLDSSQVLADNTVYFSLRVIGGLGIRDALFTDVPPDPGATALNGVAGYLIPAGATVDDMLKDVLISGLRLFLPFAAGDVIDLTGSGWPLAFAPTIGGLNPGSIAALSAAGGIRRRGRVIGATTLGSVGVAGGEMEGAGTPPAATNAVQNAGQSDTGADSPGAGGWRTTGATWYSDPPPGAGNLSAPGYHFAELGTARRTDGGATGVGWLARLFGMAGELPMGYKIDIEYGGRIATADKQDRGYGQGGDGVTSDPNFAIDLYDGSGSGLADLPGDLGFKATGLGDVRVRPHRRSTTLNPGVVRG